MEEESKWSEGRARATTHPERDTPSGLKTPAPASSSRSGSSVTGYDSTSGYAASAGVDDEDPLTPESRRDLLKMLNADPTGTPFTPADEYTSVTTASNSNHHRVETRGSSSLSASISSASSTSSSRLGGDMTKLSPHKKLLNSLTSLLPPTIAETNSSNGSTGKPSISPYSGSSFVGVTGMGGGVGSQSTSTAGSWRTNGRPPSAGASSTTSSYSATGSESRARTMASSRTASMLPSAEDLRERSSCGAEISFYSPIRVRLTNRHCLRISTTPLAEKHEAHSRHGIDTVPGSGVGTFPSPRSASTHSFSSPATSPTGSSSTSASTASTASAGAVYIDVGGDGLTADTDQVFVLVNASNRSDRGVAHFSDVVALYCLEGTCRGHLLSVDPATQQLRAKKGPIIGNSEKWRLVNPRVGTRGSTAESTSQRDTHMTSDSMTTEWGKERAVVTSDFVMLQWAHASGLLLSVRRDPFDGADCVVMASDQDALANVVPAMALRQQWTITKSNLPFDPPWNRDRGYLTGEAMFERDRHDEMGIEDTNLAPLSTFPPSVQESMVVDELLYTFVGVEGRYIHMESTHLGASSSSGNDLAREFRFVMNQYGMDPSISTLASRCFPLGEYYLRIKLYVEQFSRYEYGQVNHAFCAALRSLQKEYLIVVAQLEHQMKSSKDSFTLQKLWYLIQPSLRTMGMLSKLTDACRSSACTGGALLSEIQLMKASLAGDVKARQAFSFLMERATVPYLKMVECWIYRGELVDPYDEFMVRSDPDISPDDLTVNPYSTYWQDRFTLRQSQVPLFLSRGAAKILAAGKYLNIFRTCQQSVECPFAGPIEFTDSESAYDELIDRAYAFASRKLLEFFVVDNDLANRLASLKHYFLMDQGDLFVDFLDAAETEMRMETSKIAISRLESLLHMSLQTSTCVQDPYRDDILCFLSPTPLLAQLKAIHARGQKAPRDSVSNPPAERRIGYPAVEAFNLDLKVRWPLSLVISCGELAKYQMLFRHLFYCKHVEKKLCDAWLNHQSIKEFGVRSEFGRSFCLRQRMLHFQQNLLYYMMVEVISPRWHSFQNHLSTVDTLDDILSHHREFLDLCLKECLLSDPELLKTIYKLMQHCNSFVDYIETFMKPYFLDEETIKEEREMQRDRRAEKRARDEADAALMSFRKGADALGRKKRGAVLKRRQSSQIDTRRSRIKALSDDLRQVVVLEVQGANHEGGFRRRTAGYEKDFDSLFREFMNQLIRRSRLQRDAHLSNLCTRLDFNGYYTTQ